MATSPAVTLLLILIIGIAAGLLLQRFVGSTWLSSLTGSRRGDVTSALVGIAGSFTGYHLATLASTGRGSFIPLLVAAIVALVVVWAWRTFKF